MKKKIKNLVFSLLIAIALLLGGNFPLAISAVNSIKNLSMAEYKATNFRDPYEFSSSTGWSAKKTSNTDVTNAFTDSDVSENISKLSVYKPSTNYKGDSTDVEDGSISDFGAMMIRANAETTKNDKTIPASPVKVRVDKKDEDGNIVWKKDGNNFVYKTDANGYVLSDSNHNDEDRYVLIEEGENQGKYYEKVAEDDYEDVYYYYQTNSALSLKANSWYVISAYILTFDANASLMVSGTKFEKEVKVTDTNGVWKQVFLFLETSSDSTNSVNLRFYYGSSEGINPSASFGDTEVGVAYLDQVLVQTISQTEYLMQTIDGEKKEDSATVIVDDYSARYNYSLSNINGNFETVNDLGEGKFGFNLYEEMYGENTYNADDIGLKYQYYVNKYADDKGTDKLTDKQLGLVHKAYNEKTNVSIVLESKEFETEKPVLGEDGKQESDGDGNPKTELVAAPSSFNTNNHIVKIENNSEKYSLGLLSAPIEIKQFRHYKLTIYVKAKDASDSSTIKLISYIQTGSDYTGDPATMGEGAMQVKSQTTSPFTDDSDITNNWKEVSFYIQGSSYYDTTMQIALLADAESTVYYDNMKLESITSSTYSSGSSSQKFDLFPSSTTISSSITNGYFNSIKTENVDPSENEFPYLPSSWTKVEDVSKDVVSGIISTKNEFYNGITNKDSKTVQELIGGATNPIQSYELNGSIITPAKTNVLVMYAPTDSKDATKTHDFGYTSSSFSLSTNSVYKISFQVFASSTSGKSNFKGNIYANLIAGDKNIAEFDYEITESSDEKNQWLTYTFVVRTGSSSRSVKIELGVKDALGTVFFQKVGYKKLAEKTLEDKTKVTVDEQYLEIANENKTLSEQLENKIKLVNFDGDAFVMHSEHKVEGKDYYESLSHNIKGAEKDKDDKDDDKEEETPITYGEMGIVDTSEADGLKLSDTYTLESSFLTNPKSNSDFVMVIYNGSNYSTVVRPNSEASLSSSSYYEISVYVKTKDIADNKGLTINMDKISVKFENINTESTSYGDLSDSNDYKKFTAYVHTGSSTISGLQVTYTLGTEAKMMTGTALLSNIQITKLKDEAAYNELIEAVDSNDKTTVIKDFSTKESKSSADEDADNLTLATFFLVFSSILLVAVLVFAIVAVYIKRGPKSHNKKVKVQNKGTDIPKDGFV